MIKKLMSLKYPARVNLYKNEINLDYLKIGNQNEALKRIWHILKLIEKILLKENFLVFLIMRI